MKTGSAKAFCRIPSILLFPTTICRYRKSGKRINDKRNVGRDYTTISYRLSRGRHIEYLSVSLSSFYRYISVGS